MIQSPRRAFRRLLLLVKIAWRSFLKLAETAAQCFLILPFCFLYERIIKELQAVASSSEEGAEEEELNLMRLIAQITLNYFNRAESEISTSLHATNANAPNVSPLASPRASGEVSWINALIQQSWCQVAERANARLFLSANKLLQEKAVSSNMVKSISLASLTLGSKPPTIQWVRVMPKIKTPSLSSPTKPAVEMIYIQVAFNWESDMQGLLTIVTHATPLGSMTINLQCADVSVRGVINLILGPLHPAIPPYQRVTGYFVDRPKVSLKMRLLSDRRSSGLLNLDFEITETVGRLLKSKIKTFCLYPKFFEVPMTN